MSKIFISHSSANNAAALAVARWLDQNGWGDYFLDVTPARGLAPGERWQGALRAAADRCEAVLFLISPAWRDSRWCLAEFLLAKQLGKTIFGVLIEPTPLPTLPAEMTAEWQLCDLVAGTQRQRFGVAQDPIVPETEVSFSRAGLDRLRLGLQRAGLDASTFPWPPPSDPQRAPYRGLKALDAQDAAVFFGREAAVVRGLDTLRGMRERGVERLLVILGASGSGKSSFLRAGLQPRLERDDRHFLPLPVIRPERAVISGSSGLAGSLEAAFRARGAAMSRAAIRQRLGEPDGLARLLGELQALGRARLEPEAPAPTVVIPIDQGEELFMTEGRAEAETFLSLLAHTFAALRNEDTAAITARRPPIAIVAIRSESYARLQTEPRLEPTAPLLYSLPPIARAEFKAVIEGPAARAAAAGRQLTIEPALTERLLQDAEGADALPLLAFTLERLFVEHGGDGDLRLAEYDALGGVRGSVEAAVEAAFTDTGREPAVPSDKAARERSLRRGFIPWLARVDPETEERKRRVARWEEIPEEARPLFDRLIAARLLLRDRRRIEDGEDEAVAVEIAHEALLRQWPTLTAWLDEDADALKRLDGARRAATEWVKNDWAAAWLAHTGERLTAAEALRHRPDFDRLLGADGRAYLAACRERDEAARAEREAQQKRLTRFRLRAVGAIAALIFIGSGIGWWQQREATNRAQDFAREQQRLAKAETEARAEAVKQRRIALSRQLVAQAELIREQHPTLLPRSVLLAVEAMRLFPSTEADLALRQGLALLRRPAARLAHEGPVRAVAFSPDGTVLATASGVRAVAHGYAARLWEAASGRELARLTHEGEVWAVAFSPDGTVLATASEDATVRLWEAASGRELARLAHEGEVRDVAFSPDGTVLATTSGGTARLWEVASRREVTRLAHEGEDVVWAPTFSPDGAVLATASGIQAVGLGGTVRLWEAASGRELARLAHEHKVLALAFSPDGKVLATGGGPARLWEAASGRELARLAHGYRVDALAFSPDGKVLATASELDTTARLWEVASGRERARLAHERQVLSVAFSPDGTVLAATSRDTVRLWEAASGRALIRLAHQGFVWDVAFSPDGTVLATASGGTVRLWEAASGRERARLAHEGSVLALAFSPDGTVLATASKDTTARLWEVASGREVARLAHEGDVLPVAFSPDGTVLATASGGTVRLWEAASGREVARLAHQGEVRDVAFSPDGKVLATVGWNIKEETAARLWEVASGREVARLAHEGEAAVQAVAFSPDGKVLATTSADTTARLWEVASGRERARLAHEGSVLALAFSPDGKALATASEDATVRLWEVASGRELARLTHEGGIGALAFSPDGKVLATASGGAARLWEVASGHERARLAHEGLVFKVAFSPDGKVLATASKDTTARLWEVASGREVAGLAHERMVLSVAFSPDGKVLATTSADTTARLWLWQPMDLMAEACALLTRNLTREEWRQYLGAEPYRETCANLPSASSPSIVKTPSVTERPTTTPEPPQVQPSPDRPTEAIPPQRVRARGVIFQSVYFESEQLNLTPLARRGLDEAVKKMQTDFTLQAEIIGHANEGEFPEENNLELSKQLAETVKKYLIEQGVDSSRLLIDWKGGLQPLADARTPEGRALNRRVEMVPYKVFSPP